ncbi:MAG: copper resistance protein, partial [Proteobacteria bacterium]|nr:copper resistance protein [Pseudomonadota bacterium]
MALRFLSILISGFLLLAPVAEAADPHHHTQARLFSAVSGVDQLKTIQAAVEVKLEPGWKTYWRTPGEAGLAPVFDWAGSTNFKEA